MTAPLLLRPHYVPKPWGGRRLADELGRRDLPAGPIGESWEVFDLLDDEHPAGCSRIEGGEHDGRTLREVLGAPFPLLIKVLDAQADLSVQVHPDGQDGGATKEEAWIALADGGRVAVADPADTTPLTEIQPGTWLDHLRIEEVHAGGAADVPPSVTHIPGGTVHAILAGTLLLEVQNPADITWRLDDYDRPGLDGQPRTLHRTEAAAQLARPTPKPAPLVDGLMQCGRFRIALGRGERTGLAAGALYCTAPAEVSFGGGAPHSIPAHRTVVLPESGAAVRSDGWIIAFAS